MTDHLILSEIHRLPESLKLEVLHFVVFLRKEYAHQTQAPEQAKGERIFGQSKGHYTLAPDFDEPIDDFKEYQ